MKAFDKKKLKYTSKDTPDHILKQIKARSDKYFENKKEGKNAGPLLWIKAFVFLAIFGAAFYTTFQIDSFIILCLLYLTMGTSLLLLGINLGHDAAHHCITGNKKIDDLLFQFSFNINGMGSYYWQIRHNSSHHIFPNVLNYDSDLETTNLLLLHSSQKSHYWHKFQHIYATFLYMLSSILWILFIDFTFFFKKQQANLNFKKFQAYELAKMAVIKVNYLVIFVALPIYFSSFSTWQIISAFLIMHFLVSAFLTYTFFISHHVQEVPYIAAEESKQLVDDAWVHHQIITTIDFNADSPVANFIFGGFNLHIAHHIFPEVCHTHYPELTKIIKEVLAENKLDWYQSFSFFEGVSSHIKHLKKTAEEIIEEQDLQISQSY